MLAKDIMNTDVITFNPEMSVKEAAKTLRERRISGAPVVDNSGKMLGMISEADLIIKDIKPHFPGYIQIFDGIFFLESPKKFEEEVRKIAAVKIEEIMTREVYSIGEDTAVEDIAGMMLDKKINRLPVIKDGKIIGIVTRGDLLQTII